MILLFRVTLLSALFVALCPTIGAAATDPMDAVLPICPSDASFDPPGPYKGQVISNASATLVPDGGRFYPSLGHVPPCANQNWPGVNHDDLTYPRGVIATATPNIIQVSAAPVDVVIDVQSAGLSGPLDPIMPLCMPDAAPDARVCQGGEPRFVFRLADTDGNFSGLWKIADANSNPYFQFRRKAACTSAYTGIIFNPHNSVPCPYEVLFLLDQDGLPALQRSMQVVMTDIAYGGSVVPVGNLMGLNNGTDFMLPMVFVAGQSIEGSVKYRDGASAEGITVHLTGTSQESGAVDRMTTTDGVGDYRFDAVELGTYKVTATGEPEDENGGTLSAKAAVGGACPGTATDDYCQLGQTQSATVDFVYTPCSRPERHPNDKPPTNCPIVFVPGFLGTRIACPGEELWPNIPNARFGEMALQSDGFTNAGAAGTCAGDAYAVPGRDGVVATAAAQNVYQSAMTFLDQIAPDRWRAYTYDWRRAVPEAVPFLGETIDQLLEDTGAKRVVLMAHSMGGLVSRAYIADGGNADKVSRFVTLGTPYWGAPKTHFALLEGDTDTPGSPLLDLDVFTSSSALQHFAQNAFGAFWLYPSEQYGPWLTIAGTEQDAAGVDAWIASLGATPALLDAARAGHAQLDGFASYGIDYRAVVGVGLATVTKVGVRTRSILTGRAVSIGQWADLTYGSGDTTVPGISATQGALDDGVPVGESIPIHYACGVDHVGLPGNAGVDARIKDFLIKGDPILAGDPNNPANDNCDYTGVQVRSHLVDILQPGARVLTGGSAAVGRAGGESLSVHDAAGLGLVSLLTIGDRTTVVLDGRKPVTLQIDGDHGAMQVQTIGSAGDGPLRSYKAGKGSLAIGMDGAVAVDGKAAREVKLKSKPPRTKARLRKKRGAFLLKLTVRAPNGIGATYYQIGSDAAVRYEKPVQLTAEQVAQLSYASVDAFGNVEPWRRAKKPR